MDDILLTALERDNFSKPDFEPDNINKKLNQIEVFAEIFQELDSLIRDSQKDSLTEVPTHVDEMTRKLEERIEVALLN